MIWSYFVTMPIIFGFSHLFLLTMATMVGLWHPGRWSNKSGADYDRTFLLGFPTTHPYGHHTACFVFVWSEPSQSNVLDLFLWKHIVTIIRNIRNMMRSCRIQMFSIYIWTKICWLSRTNPTFCRWVLTSFFAHSSLCIVSIIQNVALVLDNLQILPIFLIEVCLVTRNSLVMFTSFLGGGLRDTIWIWNFQTE